MFPIGLPLLSSSVKSCKPTLLNNKLVPTGTSLLLGSVIVRKSLSEIISFMSDTTTPPVNGYGQDKAMSEVKLISEYDMVIYLEKEKLLYKHQL